MLEKDLELKNNKCSCGNGKEIDEYLGCTICETEQDIEDITIPEDESYEVSEEESPKADPEEEGTKHYL